MTKFKAGQRTDISARDRRDLGVKVGMAWSYLNLGLVARDQQQYPQAVERFRESPRLRHDLGDRRGVAACLEALGATAILDRQPDQGIRLYSAAAQLRTAIGALPLAFERDEHARHLAQVRGLMGDGDAFELAWADGQRLSLEQVLAEHVKREERAGGESR